MTNNFVKVLDTQMWRQVAPSPNAHGAGVSLASDLRNNRSRYPFILQLASASGLNRYNIIKKAWNFIVSPALAGTFGAGAGIVFAPSRALNGTVSTDCTTTSITTSTVITSVGLNMLASRGGSGEYGFCIRVTDTVAGKTEERMIVANTAGTTPTFYVDQAFSFTPSSGATYEILGGAAYMLNAGTLASGSWKRFEVTTNTLSTLTQTNLPATVSTDFSAVALDELYVPYDAVPGEGFITGASTYDTTNSKRCLLATASGASSITGQASSGDADVVSNEYRNFQIRVVEDTVTPTAVGQRRIIASHTAGPSAVYTLGTAWSVQPSSSAKFVIEFPNQIILRSSATTTVYVYNYSGLTQNNGTTTINADSWSTTYFSVAPAAMGAGCTQFASFGIRPSADKLARHSFIHTFRGGNSAAVDVLDIAGGTNGAWSTAVVIDGAVTITTGTCGKYAPFDQEGRFGYLNIYASSAVNQIYRYDVRNRVLSPETPTDWIQSGTAVAGDRLATTVVINGSDVYSMVLLLAHTSTVFFEMVIQV